MTHPDTVLSQWVGEKPSTWTDVELRLLRRAPEWAKRMDPSIVNPVDRALAGIGPVPAMAGDLEARIRVSLARADAGLQNDPAAMAELETEGEASGDPHLWVSAARLNAQANPLREAEARMAISNQVLPYVFPGEVDPVMIHLLCAGERILPALHVDWIRKITVWLAPVIALDCKQGGLWFWPVIRSLDAGKLKRPLMKLADTRLPPGGYGLAAAYCRKIGLDDGLLLDAGGDVDKRIAALAFINDASQSAR